jgi:hypothetical protein
MSADEAIPEQDLESGGVLVPDGVIHLGSGVANRLAVLIRGYPMPALSTTSSLACTVDVDLQWDVWASTPTAHRIPLHLGTSPSTLHCHHHPCFRVR